MILIFDFSNSVTKNLLDIKDGNHDKEVCMQNCEENGKIFNHPPHLCSYQHDDIKNLIQYKKLDVETLPRPVWSQDDKKAIEVVDYDFKSALATEREKELALGLRTNDDVKEVVNQLEIM